MSYVKCLTKNNYKIDKTLKETKNNIIIIIIKRGEQHVAKILNLSKTTDKHEISNMNTEISALKYLTYELKLAFFATYIR